MEPIGNGWYVLCIGGTSNKYLQLCTINDKLNLGLQINLTDSDPFVRTNKALQMVKEKYPEIDLGEHRTITSNIMLVTYKDKTYDFPRHYANAQLSCVIEAIGPSRVYRLGLKAGSKDLLMTYRISKTQYPCGDYWLNSPASIREKRKVLHTIKSMLHLDLTIELLTDEIPQKPTVSFSSSAAQAPLPVRHFDKFGLVCTLYGFFRTNHANPCLLLMSFDFSRCIEAPSCGFELSRQSIGYNGLYNIPAFIHESTLWQKSMGQIQAIADPIVFVDKTYIKQAVDILLQKGYTVSQTAYKSQTYGFQTFSITKK